MASVAPDEVRTLQASHGVIDDPTSGACNILLDKEVSKGSFHPPPLGEEGDSLPLGVEEEGVGQPPHCVERGGVDLHLLGVGKGGVVSPPLDVEKGGNGLPPLDTSIWDSDQSHGVGKGVGDLPPFSADLGIWGIDTTTIEEGIESALWDIDTQPSMGCGVSKVIKEADHIVPSGNVQMIDLPTELLWDPSTVLQILNSHDWVTAIDLATSLWPTKTAYEQLQLLDDAITDATESGLLEGKTVHCDECEVLRWVNDDTYTLIHGFALPVYRVKKISPDTAPAKNHQRLEEPIFSRSRGSR